MVSTEPSAIINQALIDTIMKYIGTAYQNMTTKFNNFAFGKYHLINIKIHHFLIWAGKVSEEQLNLKN